MSSTDRGRKRSLEVTGGPAQAAARSMLRAMGWTTEDLQLPQAGVAATWNRVTPCNMHLDELAVAAADELRSLRVLPLVFHTISVSDGIAMGTEGMRASLPSRDWIADSVELVMHAERMDGLLAIAGCDKTLPGMMMAMIRLDLPSVFAYGGSIKPGCFRGEDVTIQDVYEAHRRARDREDEPRGPHGARVRGVARQGLVREHVHGEHDGERLGGARADRVRAWRRRPPPTRPARTIVRRAAATLVDALESDRRPSAILTRASFENAIAVAAALGGSTNACLHLPALAGEAGIEFGLGDIDRISRRTPQIAEMRPAGRFMMQDLHVEGGVPVVMRELLDAGLLDGDARTVTGQTVGEALAGGRPLARPSHAGAPHRRRPRQADGRLRGALGQPRARGRRDQGREPGGQPPSRACEGVRRRAGRIPRRLGRAHPAGRRRRAPLRGPEGRAGDAGDDPSHVGHRRRRARRRGRAPHRRPLRRRHAGDLRRSHLPEAAAGGPLAILRDGDVVEIDAEASRLHVDLPDEEIAARLAARSSTRRRATRRACSRSTRGSSARPRPGPASEPESMSATRISCSEYSFPAVPGQHERIGIVRLLGFELVDLALFLADGSELVADPAGVAAGLRASLDGARARERGSVPGGR